MPSLECFITRGDNSNMSIKFASGPMRVSLPGAMLVVALLAQPAFAALGEPEASAADDARQLKASIKATGRATYRVHEIQLPSGTVVREFATVGGTVFAIAWSGPAMPDLRQTLGRYFDGYVAAARAQPGSRHHFQIRQSALVVQSSGRMRAFSGRAYLPQAVPAGTSLDEIR